MQIFVHFFLKNVNYCRKNTKKKNAGLHSSAFHTKYIKTLRKPFEGVCVTNNLIYTAHRHALAFGNWIAKVDTTPLNREGDQCLRSSHKFEICGNPASRQRRTCVCVCVCVCVEAHNSQC